MNLDQFRGIVNVTGEQHNKEIVERIVPEHVVKAFKPGKKWAVVPQWTAKTVKEKAKQETVKVVSSQTIAFSAGEAHCTGNRVGLAFDLACRMVEDGLKNVRIWDFYGKLQVFGKAEVSKRNKALQSVAHFIKAEAKLAA